MKQSKYSEHSDSTSNFINFVWKRFHKSPLNTRIQHLTLSISYEKDFTSLLWTLGFNIWLYQFRMKKISKIPSAPTPSVSFEKTSSIPFEKISSVLFADTPSVSFKKTSSISVWKRHSPLHVNQCYFQSDSKSDFIIVSKINYWKLQSRFQDIA